MVTLFLLFENQYLFLVKSESEKAADLFKYPTIILQLEELVRLSFFSLSPLLFHSLTLFLNISSPFF